MQKQHIQHFGIDADQGLNLLADALIYGIDALSCPDCHTVHDVTAKPVIDIVKAYPGTEEERLFLAFAMGEIVHLRGFWRATSIVLLIARSEKCRQEELTSVVRRTLEEILFRDREPKSED